MLHSIKILKTNKQTNKQEIIEPQAFWSSAKSRCGSCNMLQHSGKCYLPIWDEKSYDNHSMIVVIHGHFLLISTATLDIFGYISNWPALLSRLAGHNMVNTINQGRKLPRAHPASRTSGTSWCFPWYENYSLFGVDRVQLNSPACFEGQMPTVDMF